MDLKRSRERDHDGKDYSDLGTNARREDRDNMFYPVLIDL